MTHNWTRAAPADPDTAKTLDTAIETIVVLRSGTICDAGARLTALVSILAQGERQLPTAIAHAIDQHHTWDAIAHTLGITTITARYQYDNNPRRPIH
jgi:hypothetical protein